MSDLQKKKINAESYVDAGPAVGKEGTGHEDAKAQGAEVIHASSERKPYTAPVIVPVEGEN